jgi:hypothetical protein
LGASRDWGCRLQSVLGSQFPTLHRNGSDRLHPQTLDASITIQPSAGGHGGTFIPEGIRWVVERSLAWISRYRRLNVIFERTTEHLVAFIEIAFISILSRRLVRLVTQEISA